MKKSKLSTIITMLLLLSFMTITMIAIVSAQTTSGADDARPDLTELKSDLKSETASEVRVYQPKDVPEDEPATYIVMLEDPPLVFYKSDVGIADSRDGANDEREFDVNSLESAIYMDYLGTQQAESIDRASDTLGRSLEVMYQYKVVLNGYAAEMTPAEALQVARQPGVARVERDVEYELHTDNGPAWIGADKIWDGSASGVPTRGEGVVVGVIDTGIDPWNPSFLDVGDDGYDHTNPRGAGNYVGVCDPTNTSPPAGVSPYDPTFPCNDKLIGAWGYTSVNGGDPRDSDGHGSHTASTAAGNVVDNSTVETPGRVFTATQISGVAPHANIIAYAACCTGAALTAAQEQVVLDGVDVVNYSIGASALTPDPWNSASALSWMAVREAGIFVATSAGNNGPGDSTVGSPADLPWMMSVGASSHDRTFLNSITLDDGVNGPQTFDGMSMTGPLSTPTKVVFAADYAGGSISADDARLCADGVFPPGTFSGEIVICERGTYGRVAKGQTVADGGAAGYILAQPAEFGGGPGSLAPDPHVLPGVHIDYYAYQDLLAYFAAAPGDVMGTIAGSTMDIDDKYGNIMASFSSRGPNGGLLSDIPIPNVTAPGRAIWAAYHQGDGGDGDYTFNVIQGTSMSSPHVAGAGALMVALYPDWSPAQIQSALMTTSDTDVINDDGTNAATPFAMGAGHINLENAAAAGFVLDVTPDEFKDADPREGGDPKDLNLASFGNSQCVGECTWTRVISSTASMSVTWTASHTSTDNVALTIEPASFALAPGATQMITVTADVSAATPDTWAFATVEFASSEASVPDTHFPVSVRATVSALPTLMEISTNRNAGSQWARELVALEITDMTINSGFTKAGITDFNVEEDPTNGIPDGFFDDLDQVFWTTHDVPAGTVRVVQEIVATSSPDLDMAMGRDTNGNGLPEADEIVCQSASGGSFEYCSVMDPQPGTWWVVVMNYEASGAGVADAVSLATAVINNNDGLAFDAPTTVPASTPFDVNVYWDESTMMAGDYWYGYFDLGTDAGNAGNLGAVPVNLVRIGDDVVKSADVSYALPGDTVEYTITVNPNNWDEEITYSLFDVIPDGLTYVPGSAQADIGSVTVVGNLLSWTGTLEVPNTTYNIVSNATEASCNTPFGGYFDLATIPIATDSGISGDTIDWGYSTLGAGTDFYGQPILGGPTFTDDGFVEFLGGTVGPAPWVHQSLPDPTTPNALAAIYWRDMEIVYDEPTNKGVTAAGNSSLWIVEYDDIQEYDNPANHLDMQIISWYQASPLAATSAAEYDMYFAYDNVAITDTVGTVGIENADGSDGTEFAYDDFAPADGLVVCLDLISSAVPVEITYEVTVDADVEIGSEIVNAATHSIDYEGTKSESAPSSLHIGMPTYLPAIFRP